MGDALLNHDCGHVCSRLYPKPSPPPWPVSPTAYSYAGVPPGTSEYMSQILPFGFTSVVANAVSA